MKRTFTMVLAAGLVLCALPAIGEPTIGEETSGLSIDEMALNQGEPQRVLLAQLEGLMREPGVVIWKYKDRNWLGTDRMGEYVDLSWFFEAYPSAGVSDLFEAYRFDFDGDSNDELIVEIRSDVETGKTQFGTTFLTKKGEEWVPFHYPQALLGESFSVEDIRDHDGDGRPEVLLAGRAGDGEFYSYYGLYAFDAQGKMHSFTTVAPDTVHIVDLDLDGAYEFLVRHLVSRRGPRPMMWTLVDQVRLWNGSGFVEEPASLVQYHDQITKPRLIDELIDFYDAELFLLQTKIDVIQQVHAHILAKRPIEVATKDVVRRARRLMKRGRRKRARTILQRAVDRDPYRVSALRELAAMDMWRGRYRNALTRLYQVLGADPDNAKAWESMGVCFAHLQERSSSVAALVNSVRLSAEPEARRKRLERLRVSHRSEAVRSVIRRALEALDGVSDDVVDGDELLPE